MNYTKDVFISVQFRVFSLSTKSAFKMKKCPLKKGNSTFFYKLKVEPMAGKTHSCVVQCMHAFSCYSLSETFRLVCAGS